MRLVLYNVITSCISSMTLYDIASFHGVMLLLKRDIIVFLQFQGVCKQRIGLIVCGKQKNDVNCTSNCVYFRIKWLLIWSKLKRKVARLPKSTFQKANILRMILLGMDNITLLLLLALLIVWAVVCSYYATVMLHKLWLCYNNQSSMKLKV